MFRVASIQLELKDGQSPAERMNRVLELIDQAGEVDLILLPEIWRANYFAFDTYREHSEGMDGPTVAALSDKARQKRAYIVGGSFVEQQRGGDLTNTTVLLDRQGNVAATYRKMHLFGYESAESKLLTRGRDVVVAETELGRFGLSTCYDLRFPELYRQMVDKGAEGFLVVAAWPYPRLHHWQTLNAVRAFENQCVLISCNCCGLSHGARALGHSMVVDPWGTTVAGGGDIETVVKAEVDMSLVQRFRAQFPALKDRVL